MVQVVCEWSLAGVRAWAASASVFVIVDVLSFSTAVSVAMDRGAEVAPFHHGEPEAAAVEARRLGALAARTTRALSGEPNLSPSSLKALPLGARLLLPSPNGSRLSVATGATPTLCGCLRNASAVARAASARAGDGPIAIIAAGERWPDQSLRPAVEDWLGAGAIITAIADAEMNAEASMARQSFSAMEAQLHAVVRDCVSGRELIDRGFAADVDLALERDASTIAPILGDGIYAADRG
jgi:2-phosphosulfolactate phosphatase